VTGTPNPYAPPSSEAAASPAREPWWQRRFSWLGGFEILAGLLLGFVGFVTSGIHDDPSDGLVGLFAFGWALLLVTLPGALLILVRHPLRWAGQALLLAFPLWYLPR